MWVWPPSTKTECLQYLSLQFDNGVETVMHSFHWIGLRDDRQTIQLPSSSQIQWTCFKTWHVCHPSPIGCTVLDKLSRQDRLAGKATITSGLWLVRFDMLRSLRNYLEAYSQGHHTTGHREVHSQGHHTTDHLEAHSQGHYTIDHLEVHSQGHHTTDHLEAHSQGHYTIDHLEVHSQGHHTIDHLDVHSQGHHAIDYLEVHSQEHHTIDHLKAHSQGHHTFDHLEERRGAQKEEVLDNQCWQDKKEPLSFWPTVI